MSAGYGFHFNDARGVTIVLDPVTGESVSPVDPLVESRGAELGFKTVWLESWNASLALWYLELDSEPLVVGDAGTTEASRPSERWGLEFNNFWALDEVWQIQMDILNLFDSDGHDVDHFYASRLREEVADGVKDIHYHVFEPRQVRVYPSRDF